MNLCILSGKGGTGKTTIAVNLAILLRAQYCDCDVEEPNGFLFLQPGQISAQDTLVDCPSVDKERCTLCGQCVKACKFHALASTKKSLMVFENLCHGCHACEIACDDKAISFKKRAVGTVEKGVGSGVVCMRGVLNVGEHMAVPVIRHLLRETDRQADTILDCAPGTSCNVVNTLRRADAALIVTEPTAFGLHDMEIAAELLRRMNIPMRVVINKSRGEDELIRAFCRNHQITVIGTVPYDRDAACAYSKGQLLSDLPTFRPAFEQIARGVKEAFGWN